MTIRPLLATAACLFAGACTSPGAPEGASRPPGAGEPPAPGAVRVVATDRGYDAPGRVSAGLRHVVFENHGSQIHEAMFVRLPAGMTAEDYVAAVAAGAAFPEGARDYSGPGLTSPGGRVEMWLTLDPGNYLLICWFRDHATTAPVHRLVVEADGAEPAVPPPADAVLRLVDFRFDLEGELRAGSRVIRIETPGPSMHEVDFSRLDEGADLAAFRRWRTGDRAGRPPALAVGGALDRHDAGAVAWLRLALEPGRYVLWCGMPMGSDADASSEVTHADLGMVRELVIAE